MYSLDRLNHVNCEIVKETLNIPGKILPEEIKKMSSKNLVRSG